MKLILLFMSTTSFRAMLVPVFRFVLIGLCCALA
jgi:hypothetical protein